ncbi:50S ribosomal protein L14 [Candidatus Woesearchaeota archaeon]|nr:50S ribosomal protein L14 [Candidatus Woesearchaeota archaeon]
MKALKANVTKGLPLGANVDACDNSGAKTVKIFGVIGGKTTKGRLASAGIGDIVNCSVVKGRPDMRKQVVQAVIVRQKKEYKRPDGTRVKFEDNAVVVLKDDKGNPKGTLFKGPIAKEVTERWPAIAKVASIVV